MAVHAAADVVRSRAQISRKRGAAQRNLGGDERDLRRRRIRQRAAHAAHHRAAAARSRNSRRKEFLRSRAEATHGEERRNGARVRRRASQEHEAGVRPRIRRTESVPQSERSRLGRRRFRAVESRFLDGKNAPRELRFRRRRREAVFPDGQRDGGAVRADGKALQRPHRRRADRLRRARFRNDARRPPLQRVRILENRSRGGNGSLASGREILFALRQRDGHEARHFLHRLVSARVQALRRVDESLLRRRPFPRRAQLRPGLREHDCSRGRRARAAHALRRRDDFPRIRPPDASPARLDGSPRAERHERRVGLRRTAFAAQRKLDLGARSARDFREALQDGRAAPAGSARKNDPRAEFSGGLSADAPAQLRLHGSVPAHQREKSA